ncbi:hypothetical protein [Dysgonomonas sp. ZJ709]|uniref:hypothetical protein n=1 Tax=Dysgonomonas sp. ZJ709 TaxID=2709797 RepID=UPI0013ED8CC7|nr:hypothetical protein [Dysgonomonas sp. ZJ709]
MKRILLLVIISLGIACSQMQAQTYEYIYPQYKEMVGYYYATPTSGPLYNQSSDIKVKANTTLQFDLSSATFWNGCTNFTWYVNLPGGATPVISGRDCKVELSGATGWAVISVDALDKDGYRHRSSSFMIEIIK